MQQGQVQVHLLDLLFTLDVRLFLRTIFLAIQPLFKKCVIKEFKKRYVFNLLPHNLYYINNFIYLQKSLIFSKISFLIRFFLLSIRRIDLAFFALIFSAKGLVLIILSLIFLSFIIVFYPYHNTCHIAIFFIYIF